MLQKLFELELYSPKEREGFLILFLASIAYGTPPFGRKRTREDRRIGPGIGKGNGRFLLEVFLGVGFSFKKSLCLSVTFAQPTQSKDYVLTPAAWNWVAKD